MNPVPTAGEPPLSSPGPVSSPISTGGGGEHFEQHVGAFALGLLLVQATPPVLTNTKLAEVHLQTAHQGWQTDDLLLIGTTGAGVRRKLAVQVKRTFRVAAADEDCRNTFVGMWNDFLAADRFDRSQDRLAVVTLHGTTPLLQSFGSLLDCAQATVGADDLARRLGLEGHISKKAKEQYATIEKIVGGDKGDAVDKEVLWSFLRTLSVLSFDLNTTTAQTEAHLRTLLSQFASAAPDPGAVAASTWAELLRIVGQGRPSAATYTRDTLPQTLRDSHGFIPTTTDQARLDLSDHGRVVRAAIRTTIGATVYHLEAEMRSILAAFCIKLDRKDAIAIGGQIADLVDRNPRDVAEFAHDLLISADGGAGDRFWDVWQTLADRVVKASWLKSDERDMGWQLVDRLFLATFWKEGVTHWSRLEGQSHRLDTLAENLPATPRVLRAYTRFLDRIGERSLPNGLRVVGDMLKKGEAVQLAGDSDAAVHLETILRRFVYVEPRKTKSDAQLRDAVLLTLDALVGAGSSSAYRMRDDFVTPVAPG